MEPLSRVFRDDELHIFFHGRSSMPNQCGAKRPNSRLFRSLLVTILATAWPAVEILSPSVPQAELVMMEKRALER